MTYEEKLEAAGHVLRRDKDGNVDVWVLDLDYHNGPGCVNCNESWCHHCEDPIEPCIGLEEYQKQCCETRYEIYLKLKAEFE